MTVLQIIGEVALMAIATILIVLLIGLFSRRILGVRIGAMRIIIAGIVALAAELGFESQVIWGASTYSPVMVLVQLGIILLVATAFLVVAELVLPQGSVPGPGQLARATRDSSARARRYSQLLRIAYRHRLVPFKLNTDPTSAGSAERTRQAMALRSALEDAGGAFIKLGQLLSTRTDVLPVEFTTGSSRSSSAMSTSPGGSRRA